MYKGKLNDTRYDDLGNLMKQLFPKEKLGGTNPKMKKSTIRQRFTIRMTLFVINLITITELSFESHRSL